jgi:hypothetical protein
MWWKFRPTCRALQTQQAHALLRRSDSRIRLGTRTRGPFRVSSRLDIGTLPWIVAECSQRGEAAAGSVRPHRGQTPELNFVRQ